LAVTLAESCFASRPTVGASVKVRGAASDEDALFSERGARCVVSVAPAKLAALHAIARQYSVAASEVGEVTQNAALRIEYQGRAVIDSPIEILRESWATSLERALQSK
jgi:phosphoribosylformylglycinamidine (FGAM) synthase-like enzyme